MTPYRIFVEKKKPFRLEAESLKNDLNSNLGLNIKDLRLISVYDLFGFTPELLERSSARVFGEPATDVVSLNIDYDDKPFLGIEALPGQFDQRAAAAEECVKLIQPDADISIRSGKLLIFDKDVSKSDIDKIAKYVINAVEARKKDMSKLEAPGYANAKTVEILDGFRDISPANAEAFCKKM